MGMSPEDFQKQMKAATVLELLTTATCCVKELVDRGMNLKLTFWVLQHELTRVVKTLEMFGKE